MDKQLSLKNNHSLIRLFFIMQNNGNTKNNLTSVNHRIGTEGIRYLAASHRKNRQLNKTTKRHISARSTERWRFGITILLLLFLLFFARGAWLEWQALIL